MSKPEPIPLAPFPIQLGSADFATISGWPFEDEFVGRILRDDIPQRVWLNRCQIWGYREPGGQFAGFGTIEACSDHGSYTEGGGPAG